MISRQILNTASRIRIRNLGVSFSTKLESSQSPSSFVQGVTVEDLQKNAAIADYFAANFPTYGNRSIEFERGESTDLDDHDDESEAKDVVSPYNIRSLQAYLRDGEGSKESAKLRLEDMIPGIIYGSDPTQKILSIDSSSKILVKTPLFQLQRELDRFTYHNFESHVYDLTVYHHEDDTEGTVHRVLPKNVQFHPVQNKLYCVNYLRYFPGRPINLPIVYINEEESPALKRGGFIAPISRHVKCIVEDGVRIPDHVEMDCTGLSLKDVIRIDRIIFPDGVKASKTVDKKKFLIGTVFGRRSDVDDA